MPLQRGTRLADVQASQVEVGRIRLGTSTKKTSRGGKEYNEPVKLERFRLTSKSQQLIQDAASVYGGEVEPWQPERGAQQWEVIIERDSLAVVVPPDPLTQYYEQWSGGRCQVRCTGLRELINDTPCLCGPDPERRKCKPTTRLSLMLAELNGVGVWRLETHGYYAASELPAVVDLLSAAGGNIAARLEMEERQAEVPDPRNAGKTVISKFMVPVLHVEATPGQLLMAITPHRMLESSSVSAIPVDAAPERAALPAAPAAQAPAGPPGAIAVPPEDQERLAPSWKLYTKIQDAIGGATTKEQMIVIRDKIALPACQEVLIDGHKAELTNIWNARAKALAATPTASPATPVAVPQPPAAVQLDRQAVFVKITTWAGFNNLKMSELKVKYGEHSGGKEMSGASAEELHAFGLALGVTF